MIYSDSEIGGGEEGEIGERRLTDKEGKRKKNRSERVRHLACC